MTSRCVLLTGFVFACAAVACADEPWFGGERLRCGAGPGDFPFSPGGVDVAAGLAPVVGGACLEGAEPHPELEFDCADTVGPCACRFICAPTCASGQICTEAGECTCDPAYGEGLFGCEWRGLVDNASLETCDGWRFFTAPGNQPTSMIADIEGNKLRLAVTMPCTGAAAEIDVRLPARRDMAGAALVFEYTATTTPEADPTQSSAIEVGLVRRFALAPTDEPRTHRECIRLEESPRTGTFGAVVQRFGACFPETPTDWELRIDNVRLEADAACANE